MFYIFSTLTCDQDYTNFVPGGGDLPVELQPVRIKGGAGVANDRLVTPRGVMTEVTEEQVEYLRQNEVFRLHEKNGYVMISAKKADPDKAAADLTGRSPDAPLVPQDMTLPDTEVFVGDVPLDLTKRSRKK